MSPVAVRLLFVALILATGRRVPAQDLLPPPRRGAGHDLGRRLLDVRPEPFNQNRIAGLPVGSKPELLTWERVYRLAAIHAQDPPPPRLDQLNLDRVAEEARQLGVDNFPRFRTQYVTSRTFRDPAADFLDLQARVVQIDQTYRYLAYVERWTELLKELIEGEASGLGQVDLDQSSATAVAARRAYGRLVAKSRDQLDSLKVALGVAPRVALTIDLAPLDGFREVFEALDRWSLTANRELSELSRIVSRLPAVGELTIQGRSILTEVEADPDRLEEVLDLTTRFALGNRHGRDEGADAVELRVRRRVRNLVEIRADYRSEMQATVLAARLLDSAFEQIIAPPAGLVPRVPGQTTAGLVGHAQANAEHRSRLVGLWNSYQAERLAFERDLGLVIATDWPSFLGRFTAEAGKLEPETPPAAGQFRPTLLGPLDPMPVDPLPVPPGPLPLPPAPVPPPPRPSALPPPAPPDGAEAARNEVSTVRGNAASPRSVDPARGLGYVMVPIGQLSP